MKTNKTMETQKTNKMKEEICKIFSLCFNTKSGQIYVYLNSTKYEKKYPLKKDAFGYFVVSGKMVERFTAEDTNKIIDWINN